MGLVSCLLIVFIVLKLTNNLDWDWLWVLSPLWIPFALVIAILVFAVILGIVFDK